MKQIGLDNKKLQGKDNIYTILLLTLLFWAVFCFSTFGYVNYLQRNYERRVNNILDLYQEEVERIVGEKRTQTIILTEIDTETGKIIRQDTIRKIINGENEEI